MLTHKWGPLGFRFRTPKKGKFCLWVPREFSIRLLTPIDLERKEYGMKFVKAFWQGKSSFLRGLHGLGATPPWAIALIGGTSI